MQSRLNSSSSIMLGGVAAAVMVTLLAGATPAAARPAHQSQGQVWDHQAEGWTGQSQARHQRATHRSPRDQHSAGSGDRRHAASARVSRAPAAEGQQRTASAGDTDVVREARRWLGGNPTRRNRLWCAAFMNFVLERTGRRGSGSDLARSFASYGHRVSGPQIGAIAVMTRKGGGHVGVVSGIDAVGNPIIISGNHGHRVAEAVYPGRRVYAYVMP
ncbi:MAG TPA: TIGR02594 family protein [Xanthobacteraceae bacterium]|jgi:uncharacterized protein (TIGR02594 family)|nr:TIGR02594 family protein [Xanthobacteraceae bacterium]